MTLGRELGDGTEINETLYIDESIFRIAPFSIRIGSKDIR